MVHQTIDTTIAEFEALRAEILFRLEAQQQIINYSLVAAGLLATILGLSTARGERVLVLLLLVGPVVTSFLQLIYAKHHAFIDHAAQYIRYQLHFADGTVDKTLLFSGWEEWLSSLYAPESETRILLRLLGYAEGGFPSIIGILYLIAVPFVFVTMSAPGWLETFLYIVWALVDVTLITVAIYTGAQLRERIASRRGSA